MQTGKFVGPEGTEIQWAKAAGLLTIPAALAAKIPGFGANAPTAEGTTSVSAAPGKTITTEKVEEKGFNWLWPLLSEPPKATIRTETSEDVTTVVRYEDSAAATETTARVTYENNALGDDQESVADKSDTISD